MTGRDTNGFAEPGTTRFHTIWQIDNHEGVHTLVILQIGHPPALFNEGVAVGSPDRAGAIDPDPAMERDRPSRTREAYDAAGRIPPLSSLLRSTDFFGFDANVMYPCAGSFVRYLIDTFGLAPLKR